MFEDKERRVFHYDVRGEGRYVDPLAVRRALMRFSGGQYHVWRQDAVESDEAADLPIPPSIQADEQQLALERARRAATVLGMLDAQERLLACVREAFGLPALDTTTGEGCTESECWAVLTAFDEWLEKNVRGVGDSQTTSPADSRHAPAT